MHVYAEVKYYTICLYLRDAMFGEETVNAEIFEPHYLLEMLYLWN